MNFDWFEEQWKELVVYADDGLMRRAEPFLENHTTCTMMDGMKIIDELTRRSRGKKRKTGQSVVGTERVAQLTNDQLDAILGVQEQVHGLFFCAHCRTADHTTFDMKQTRSGDEGMTAFIRCNKCASSWKR